MNGVTTKQSPTPLHNPFHFPQGRGRLLNIVLQHLSRGSAAVSAVALEIHQPPLGGALLKGLGNFSCDVTSHSAKEDFPVALPSFGPLAMHSAELCASALATSG